MSADRQKLVVARGAVLPQHTTPEQRYWRQYTSTQLVKEHNSVTHISFNPTSPYDFAVTASTRAQIFSARTRQVVKTFSRFKDVVYSASFRSDGKLLVAGDATGLVSVYDSYNPRSILLTIQASSHPVHVTKFHSHDNKLLITASDDRVTRIWDISRAYDPLFELKGATDYVRTVTCIPDAPHLYATGSYDGLIRLYDTRKEGSTPIYTLNQTSPVEYVIAASPTQLISCGGPGFKVWDLSSNRLMYDRQNFNKTATCLDYIEQFDSPMPAALVVSSLDGHVKVFDPFDDFKVKFGWKFSSAVLSCAVSPAATSGNRHLVVGMSSGLLAIRTRAKKTRVSTGSKTKESSAMYSMGDTTGGSTNVGATTRSNSFQRMMKGSDYEGAQERILHDDKAKVQKRLRGFERNIARFRWSEALDSAFVPGTSRELTLTALQELRKRGKMRVALYNRDEASLEPLLNWCMKAIEDVRSVLIVADWIAVVLDMYGGLLEASPVLREMLVNIRNKVRQEIYKAREAQKIEGMLQLLNS